MCEKIKDCDKKCNLRFHGGLVVEIMPEVDAGRLGGKKMVFTRCIADNRVNKVPYDLRGNDCVVAEEELQVLCTCKFKVGEPVKRINGTLQGVVTGYELVSNRVIVMSDKIEKYNDDRTRYAYTVKELEKHEKPVAFKFTPGKWYIWNDFKGDPSMAVQQNRYGTEIMLVSTLGHVVLKDIPMNTDMAFLKKRFKMDTIREV